MLYLLQLDKRNTVQILDTPSYILEIILELYKELIFFVEYAVKTGNLIFSLHFNTSCKLYFRGRQIGCYASYLINIRNSSFLIGYRAKTWKHGIFASCQHFVSKQMLPFYRSAILDFKRHIA